MLKRLIAYAKSSANLLTELVKGNEDDRKWLVRLITYHDPAYIQMPSERGPGDVTYGIDRAPEVDMERFNNVSPAVFFAVNFQNTGVKL